MFRRIRKEQVVRGLVEVFTENLVCVSLVDSKVLREDRVNECK